MILSRKSFTYKDFTIMEKVVIKLPFRYDASFQNEGCFLFMKEVNAEITAITETSTIHHKEAVLLKCGTYFVDWVNSKHSEKVEVIAFHLPSAVLKELYKNELPFSLNSKVKSNHATPIAKDEVLSKFVEGLEFYFDNPKLINNDTLALKIKELILLLLQSANFESIQHLFSTIFSPNDIHLKEVIQSHLFSGLSINDLAKLTNMSLSSFKREFQKQYNTPPGEYILKCKLKKAHSLIESTNLTIAEIAFEVGFNDPSYFSRVFKSKTGHNPSYFQQHS